MNQLEHRPGVNDGVRDPHGPDLDSVRGATEDGGRTTFSCWHDLSSALRGCASDQAETARFLLDASTTTAPLSSMGVVLPEGSCLQP